MSANSPRLINIEGVEVGDKIRVITVVDGVQIIKTGVVGYIQNQNNVRTGSTIEGGTLFFYGAKFKSPQYTWYIDHQWKILQYST